jgi:hypothetical protein
VAPTSRPPSGRPLPRLESDREAAGTTAAATKTGIATAVPATPGPDATARTATNGH